MKRLLDETKNFASRLRFHFDARNSRRYRGAGRATSARPDNAGPAAAPPVVAGDAQAVTSCEIRVISTVAELVESYRLRHDVYRALGYLPRVNRSRLELDAYDLSAVPFGAFDPDSGRLIGTLRLIAADHQLVYQPRIQAILADAGDRELTEQVLRPRARPLPGIISDATEHQIAAFNPMRFAVKELSRFIVRPGYRGSGISRGLALMGIAYAMRAAPAVIIAGCLPEHNQMYARYGFGKLPHTGLDHFDSVGRVANTIISRTDVVPEPTRYQLDELLGAIASGMPEHTLELGRDSYARYRFGTPRRSRQGAVESVAEAP